MKLCLINHSYKYELEKLIRIFLPFEKIEFFEEKEEGERVALTSLLKGKTETELSAELIIENNRFTASNTLFNNNFDYDKECERLLAVALYNCFVSASGYVPEWGILTGVRPAKLFSRLCSADGLSSAEDWFKKGLMVSENKISLCRETVEGEERITALSAPDSYSLYISIPFCPTRCAYCSFVSHSVEQAKNLIPDYIRLLKEELRLTAEIAAKLNLRLETVYIGGGTPTALTAEQLGEIMTAVKDFFDLNHLREYTVEAGRPDTVTAEKLDTIKRLGATRISINPQTMNDEVLKKIGRRHTAEDTERAFMLAREHGFDNINTDLIAGLPGDDFESFKATLKRVLALNPESVTVHSLSMKRSSTLNVNGLFPEAKMGAEAAKMVNFARDTLTENGIFPYYMYRQSKTVGNLENVGYAKRGAECLYNVFTMDETHTVLACGASAVTKLREPGGPYIERIFNYKYPYEYISRFDELAVRKDGVLKFYEKYPTNNK
ncbi:MAG: coproporphyrinogen dehydrogenase HemZ [Acutalibacteraceae bacterium]